jgi:hypothetical protein
MTPDRENINSLDRRRNNVGELLSILSWKEVKEEEKGADQLQPESEVK